MDIERVTVEVRQRTAFEALDLGVAMVRHWGRAIYATHALFVLTAAVALYGLLHDLDWWVPILVLWWLKPLFDRLILAVLSRAFFGQILGPWQVLRDVGELLGRGLLGSLTWRRFSFWRSYSLPIDQLERLRGEARAQRARLITSTHTLVAMALTPTCLAIEMSLVISCYLLLDKLVPEGLFGAPHFFGEEAVTWAPCLLNGMYALAVIVSEPVYVATGFALYICRRVDLEGWDIDLAFRRLANRLRRVGAALGVILVVTLGAAAAFGSAVASQDEQADEPDFRGVIQEVLEDPVFGKSETRMRWQLIDSEEELAVSEPSDSGFLQGLVSVFARMLMWTTVAALLIFALVVVAAIKRRQRRRDRVSSRAVSTAPAVLFGLDVRPESLPAELIDAVRRAWWAGEQVLALSLLYRGALAHVVGKLGVSVPSSATEGECMRLVGVAVAEPLATDFRELTLAWRHTAYAKRPPDARLFAHLTERWAGHLGEQEA